MTMNTNDTQSTGTADGNHAEPAYEAVLIFDGARSLNAAAAAECPTLAANARSTDGTGEAHYAAMEDPAYASL
ncbi:hypothetical protein [Salinibaculum salinum]|uniref:hypothetical protein n=1 Tax=Salinibaculum salinum TaxID=3131996 RepID=UPI0030EEB213